MTDTLTSAPVVGSGPAAPAAKARSYGTGRRKSSVARVWVMAGKGRITVNGKPQPYFQQLVWSGLVTGPYLPSTVFPAGLSSAGLPIGLQAVGAAYHDHMTIEFARLLAQETGGFQAPPGY